jgi:hypothetical protein
MVVSGVQVVLAARFRMNAATWKAGRLCTASSGAIGRTYGRGRRRPSTPVGTPFGVSSAWRRLREGAQLPDRPRSRAKGRQ